MGVLTRDFLKRGWRHFAADPALADWAAHARPEARRLAADRALQAKWLRCGATWFAGVNVLTNTPDGAVAGSAPLAGAAVDFISAGLGLSGINWDAGQVSVCYPGYPRPWSGESTAASRYRRARDAAHLDGLLPVGAARRRHLCEHHAFILGLPLTLTSPDAAPLVVWEGSHEVLRAALRAAFVGTQPQDWADVDVTDIYRTTRQRIFRTCRRVAIHAQPGEAYLIHRLALHGISPWAEGAAAPSEGRVIAYFRPDAGFGPATWLDAP